MRSLNILGLGAVVLAASSLGCAKADMTRTPEQWRDDVAVQMTPLADDFRACYQKSKAAWAKHADAMKGGTSVASSMKPKPRETVIVRIEIDSVAADPPKVDASQGYDDKVPKEEITSDGDLANCVRDLVKSKVKVPPKSDDNKGYGTWRVTFVPDAPAAAPTVAPEPPKS